MHNKLKVEIELNTFKSILLSYDKLPEDQAFFPLNTEHSLTAKKKIVLIQSFGDT